MTPIEKNVRVVDEQGNEYEATYPKRAKGLVKNGRARFVDEQTICLACPPETFKEDKQMSDKELKINTTTGEVIESTESTETVEQAKEAAKSAAEYTKAFEAEFASQTDQPAHDSPKYTIAYALERLDKVREDSMQFSAKIADGLFYLKSEGAGDVGTAAVGNAFMQLIEDQQATYQKLIDFYSGMIAELRAEQKKAATKDPTQQFLDFVAECAPKVAPGSFQPNYAEIWAIMNGTPYPQNE